MNRAPGNLRMTSRQAPWRWLVSGLLLICAGAVAQTENPPRQTYGMGPPGAYSGGYPGGYPQGYAPGYPPRQSDSRPGGQPGSQPGNQRGSGSGGYPARQGYRPMPGGPSYYQPQQVMARSPYLETSLDVQGSAYVHQNLVLTIDIVSSGNLKSVSVVPPESEQVIFRKLTDPSAESRRRDKQQEIVNRLHYQLTPLQVGTLQLDAIRVTGTTAQGQPFEAVASQPIRLEILPPNSQVQPWLPLHRLDIQSQLLDTGVVEQGKPVTLIVIQQAIGLSGAQLPSPESQLKSRYYRLYREKTETEGKITEGGRLTGTRIDRFSLVPLQNGQLHIPGVTLDWWSVDNVRPETAMLPSHILNQDEEDLLMQADVASWGLTSSGRSWLFWLPFVLMIGFAGLYWLWIWSGEKPVGRQFRQQLRIATQPARQYVRDLLIRLSIRRRLHLLRRNFADSLPRAYRLWFCVRVADEVDDPDDYIQVLRFLMNRRLGIKAQRPISGIVEDIITIHHVPEPDKVRGLFRELEATLFGNGAIEDFTRWKSEFKQQIKPRVLTWLHWPFRRREDVYLPALNPEV